MHNIPSRHRHQHEDASTNMTRKRGKMTIAFAVLCLMQLSTAAIANATETTAMKTIAEHEITGHTIIAPQMLDDQRFATLTVNGSMAEKAAISCSVKVVGPKYNGRNCVLPPSVKPTTYVIYRISRKTALLPIYAVNENLASMPMRLLLVNTLDCTIHYAYDGTLPKTNYYIFTNTNSFDERFTLITYGKRYCADDNWCRLHFDPFYRKHETLDFDFSPGQVENIKLATDSRDTNLLVVHVRDSKTNSTVARLYDLSKDRRGSPFIELLATPFSTPYSACTLGILSVFCRPFSSGLSYCWQVPRSFDVTTENVQCVRFWENGTLMFNETIPSPGLELRVQTVPNGLAVFTTKGDCYLSSWCKTVQVAVVTRDLDSGKGGVEIQRREYKLKCPYVASTLKVQLNVTDNTIKYLEYLCKDDLYVSTRIIYGL